MNDDNIIEEAKLALSEPGGESPPFIVMIGRSVLVEIDSGGVLAAKKPWIGKRMPKKEAQKIAESIEQAAAYWMRPVVVSDWRKETNAFIEKRGY